MGKGGKGGEAFDEMLNRPTSLDLLENYNNLLTCKIYFRPIQMFIDINI